MKKLFFCSALAFLLSTQGVMAGQIGGVEVPDGSLTEVYCDKLFDGYFCKAVENTPQRFARNFFLQVSGDQQENYKKFVTGCNLQKIMVHIVRAVEEDPTAPLNLNSRLWAYVANAEKRRAASEKFKDRRAFFDLAFQKQSEDYDTRCDVLRPAAEKLIAKMGDTTLFDLAAALREDSAYMTRAQHAERFFRNDDPNSPWVKGIRQAWAEEDKCAWLAEEYKEEDARNAVQYAKEMLLGWMVSGFLYEPFNCRTTQDQEDYTRREDEAFRQMTLPFLSTLEEVQKEALKAQGKKLPDHSAILQKGVDTFTWNNLEGFMQNWDVKFLKKAKVMEIMNEGGVLGREIIAKAKAQASGGHQAGSPYKYELAFALKP